MNFLFLKGKTVPRWVILFTDLLMTGFSFSLSYVIIKYFLFDEILRVHFLIYASLYGITTGVVFYTMKIHTGLLRYSNTRDMIRIFSALFVNSILYYIIERFTIQAIFQIRSLHVVKTLFVNFFIASSLLVMLRISIKSLYNYLQEISDVDVKRVLIYGTNLTSILIKQTFESGQNKHYQVIGFLETDRQKFNTYIEQKKVYSITGLHRLMQKSRIHQIILPNDKLVSKEKQFVIDRCLALSIKVLTVPPSDQWIYGKLCLTQIQDLKIEDLLQRAPIVINNEKIASEFNGKRILITGAAGSIGSEIVRQVMSYKPACVILCDQAESPLYDIQLEIEERYPHQPVKTYIASIQNAQRMYTLFKRFRPEIIFHAAANKHVPMMELHPGEAVLTNVLGTKILADLAVMFQVEKFLMISTDKAVNPTNIMGTSKRIAEMYVQSLNHASQLVLTDSLACQVKESIFEQKESRPFKTKFITTRFGNVLGSNGSVIPRFRQQIQKGGPVTVTHPEITRYFMTIPEAVQLVLEACTMGQGGEIFIFDMGEPVKIADLARIMIKLAGHTSDKEIKIEYTGLRPGEKLYEELLNEKEKTIATHHSKIKIARVFPSTYATVNLQTLELIGACNQEDSFMIVSKMKKMIPEFVSKNSEYELLDHTSLEQANVKN
jgi:FlaA1/EpsC-like NDP-sugar epimerase